MARRAIEIPIDSSVHLEHIAPNTPTDDWVRSVFGLEETDSVDEDRIRLDYDALKTEIGNLTLLDEKLNLEAQQSSFADKKDVYRRSTIMITRDLENIEMWTKASIQSRTAWITEMFDLIWAVNPQPNQVRDYSDWAPEFKD